MTLYCDIDGTLIDKDDNIRPFVKELFERAYMKGFKIFIWSAGGTDYAQIQVRRIFTKLGIKVPIEIMPKEFKLMKNKDKTTVCIDDMEDVCLSFIRWGGTGYKVPFYEAAVYPNDRELLRIAESL